MTFDRDDVIDLCSDESSNQSSDSSSSTDKDRGNKTRNCEGTRKSRVQTCDNNSIISISSTGTEEDECCVVKSSSNGAAVKTDERQDIQYQKLTSARRQNRRGSDGCFVKSSSSSAAVKTDERQDVQVQQLKSSGRRRSCNGYRLEAGEQIVWATQSEAGKAHQAIMLHPQPHPPPANAEGMVCIQWLNTRLRAWIPRSNVRSSICNEKGAVGKNEEASPSNDNEKDNGGDTGGDNGKKYDAFTNFGRKLPKRKRVSTKRLVDTMTAKLACEQECTLGKKMRGRTTCFTNVEFAKPPRKRKNNLPSNVRAAIAIAHARRLASSAQTKTNDEGNFDGDWWQKDRSGTIKTPANAAQSHGELSVPVTLVTFGDDGSVSSSSNISLELPEFSIHSDREDHRSVRMVTPHPGCHICESHVLHHNQIDKLLGELGTVTSTQVDDKMWVDTVIEFVTKFKAVLQGLEDDSCEGISIFFHICERREAPNPIFTVAKLVQLFNGVCQIVAMVSNQVNQDRGKKLMQLLFRPWRKKFPKEVGVILQMLHFATYEIINSREDFELPEDFDQLLGVTFGLQMLQTMARNAYFDCKTKLGDNTSFLDQPLESHKLCIRGNCQIGHRPLIVCNVCGVRFHKDCLYPKKNAHNKLDSCPTCKASALLLEAARTSNLSEIYSLIVEDGASPLQAIFSETARNETALHAAVRSNNYDLASMLLFASYLLLNSDDSLLGWDIPEIAWGRDDKLCSPFKSGIDSIIKNMDVRPPVEILLFLCGRGAQQTPEDIKRALRTRQGMMLVMKELESKDTLLKSDISMGLEPLAVPVASNAGLIPLFMYIAKNFESRSTAIRWFDCRCGRGKQLMPFEGNCTTENLQILHQKQCIQSSWKCYCNYLCPVSNTTRKCGCHLADGVHHGLEVFKTSDRGFGVRTAKGVTIKKDEILCHYAGEIITSKEAKKRDQEYAKKSQLGSYLIDMDEKGQYCIDATRFRSVAALINHACSWQNCKLFRALGNHLDANFPFLGLRAKEDIGELTELSFNYGEKPVGLCLECNGEHCLCSQCCELAHRK